MGCWLGKCHAGDGFTQSSGIWVRQRDHRFEIRDVPVADSSMSPMEIWCNESQERYVLAISPEEDKVRRFETIAKRERCPFGIVGVAAEEGEHVG